MTQMPGIATDFPIFTPYPPVDLCPMHFSFLNQVWVADMHACVAWTLSTGVHRTGRMSKVSCPLTADILPVHVGLVPCQASWDIMCPRLFCVGGLCKPSLFPSMSRHAKGKGAVFHCQIWFSSLFTFLRFSVVGKCCPRHGGNTYNSLVMYIETQPSRSEATYQRICLLITI
jgi:hypothetical protein